MIWTFQGRYIPDLYDLYAIAHVAAWERIFCMILHMFPGLDLYYANPTQPAHDGRLGNYCRSWPVGGVNSFAEYAVIYPLTTPGVLIFLYLLHVIHPGFRCA